jgi:hypothetical protein
MRGMSDTKGYTPNPYGPDPDRPVRLSGMPLEFHGFEFDLASCGVELTDPDDRQRVLRVPLTAVRLVFSDEFRRLVTAPGAKEGA